MPDAIVDAIYFDATVQQHCTCTSVESREDGPYVVLHYMDSGALVSVPVDAFRKTTSIELTQLPEEAEE